MTEKAVLLLALMLLFQGLLLRSSWTLRLLDRRLERIEAFVSDLQETTIELAQ